MSEEKWGISNGFPIINDVLGRVINIEPYHIPSGTPLHLVNVADVFYLFIYCHLHSAFSIVQCSNALYRLWDGEIQGHTGQLFVRELNAHTMYNQWATAPGRSLNYPRPKFITHLCTFSNNGVYVALQLFLLNLVFDQWRRVLIPYSYRQAPWGILHARRWLYPDIHGTNGFTWYPSHRRHTIQCWKPGFYTLQFW